MMNETERMLQALKNYNKSIKRVPHGSKIKVGDMLYIQGRLAWIYKLSDLELGNTVDHSNQHPIYRKINDDKT